MVYSARPRDASDALARLSWHDFEHLLAEHYREQGYRVELVAAHDLKALGRSGTDMRLHRGSETVIVQCGQWDALTVDVDDTNQLLSVMLNEAASRGVLVTRGDFTPAARAAVRRQPRVHLVDGDVLRAMLKLPDHLDTAAPGSRPAEKVAHTAAAARRRSRSERSLAVPIGMGVVIAALLGFFVWRAMDKHDTPPPSPVAEAPAAAPPAAPAAAPLAPPAAAPEATVIPPPPAATPVDPNDGLAHELAARERARREEEDAARRKKSEDSLKVMERNTREVGGY